MQDPITGEKFINICIQKEKYFKYLTVIHMSTMNEF